MTQEAREGGKGRITPEEQSRIRKYLDLLSGRLFSISASLAIALILVSASLYNRDEISYKAWLTLSGIVSGLFLATYSGTRGWSRRFSEITTPFVDPDISRFIDFPPEYTQAGLQALNAFSDFIVHKYKDEPVKVQIEREGATVKLIIETPEGKREEIEETLESFSLVVRGEMAPSQITDDPEQALLLENRLTMMQATLEAERRTYAALMGAKEERALSLEEDVKALRNQVADLIGVTKAAVSREQSINISIDNKNESHTSLLPPGATLPQLAQELRELATALQEHAETPEDLKEAAAALEAAQAAEAEDEDGVMAWIEEAALMTLETAKDVGAGVLAAVIASVKMGL